MQKLYFLGICGTFMGSLALLAREAGHQVAGCDSNIYPPMSDLLAEQGIVIDPGFEHRLPSDALIIVGNAMSRGNPAVEQMLRRGLAYDSGPQWLRQSLLRGRRVVAVAGTHGKTTTTAMLAWLLEASGEKPGFLVGGVPGNFPVSARLGEGKVFVIEADEYDTAFFDKRSKFIHYLPQVAVLNNLEFDHADIFPDLAAIERQFHHLVRLVPDNGTIVFNDQCEALQRVLQMGCWSQLAAVGSQNGWHARDVQRAGESFQVWCGDQSIGTLNWDLLGQHNIANALSALAVMDALGFDAGQALHALAEFRAPRRRLQDLGQPAGVQVFDDFAHHPTAIASTLQGLRQRQAGGRLLVALELRSNTMRAGHHGERLAEALQYADEVWICSHGEVWLDDHWPSRQAAPSVYNTPAALAEALEGQLRAGDTLVFMSNGGFGGIASKLVERLSQAAVTSA
jgi:UDP-N-acetylmuramate: L-alanyl-gamma-D-glutamyl-meso-diaminopimelate ligase